MHVITKEPSFTFGVEEEYLLVSKQSRDIAKDAPEHMAEECSCITDAGQIVPEFLRSQIEIGTKVCSTTPELRNSLASLRKTVANVANKYDLAPIASSTHPFAVWHEQQQTNKERYNTIANDLQDVARRLIICGMHVHVAVEDNDLRIDLMNQASYFLPHLLALSTSSPFWNGRNSGLESYRLSIFNQLPRTGLPEKFVSWAQYERHVNVLVNAGFIEDSSKLWWDLRPSSKYPTLELRIADVCPLIEDSICIASIYRCIIRMLYRLRKGNHRWRAYSNMLIEENRWRAQRYSIKEGLIDFGIGKVIPFPELMEELIELLHEDAIFFDCEAEIKHVRKIIDRGTSSHRQVTLYNKAISEGATELEAGQQIVDMLIDETTKNLDKMLADNK
ncbi:MAG: carboxylate-amine ligase [Alphaproteobacteria bacterium]|nr:carboxylate-amine ligase [Alphaproteobacteria bacterium]